MSKKSLLNESQVRQFMKLASLEPLTPGFVTGLKEAGMYRDDDDLDESHGNGANETNRASDGTGRRRDRAGNLEEVEAGPEELEDFAADDLADDSLEGDEEAATDELEADAELGAEAPAAEGRMVSVDEFLSALETALEGVLGDEVEIDSDEMEAEEDEVEADVELDAADDMEMDVAVDDEEMLQETGAEDTGASKDDESKTHKGEKDYTTKKDEDLKDDEPGGRGEKKGDKAYVNEANDELVEAITKRVAARILKSALAKK
jgi:hypothetical protein